MGDVYNFEKFREKKDQEKEPLFNQPVELTLGDVDDPKHQIKYEVISETVYHDDYFLALQSVDEDDDYIVLVKAIVKHGKLSGVATVDKNIFKEIKKKFSHLLEMDRSNRDHSYKDFIFPKKDK